MQPDRYAPPVTLMETSTEFSKLDFEEPERNQKLAAAGLTEAAH